MGDNLSRLKSSRFLVIGTLLLTCVGLEYWLHIVYGITYVYPHLFYVPIIVAALWWGLRGGLLVSLFLALMHAASYLAGPDQITMLRCLAFVLVGLVTGIIVNQRRRAEEHIEHLNNILKAIRNVNQLIIVEKDRDSLLQKVCDTLIEARGYDAAWFGFLKNDRTFAAAVGSGFGEDISRFSEHVLGGDYVLCIKKTLSQKDLFMVVDKRSECGDCFLKKAHLGREVAIIRVEHDSRLFGLLAILLSSDATVDDEEKELLKEVTGDIAFALHDIELEEKRKQAEEELREHREHLEELVKKRTSELEEANRHKSQFLANMSHELRTPLNSIIGYTKLMADGLAGDIDEKQEKFLHIVYRNSKHLLELINGLLDLSRIEAGKTVLSYEVFPISDLLSEVIPSMEQLGRERGLVLTYSVAPDIDSLYADKAKTRQVLINILGNAVKFTSEGSVKLNVAETDSELIFSVTDTGMGINEDDLEAIFDSFKQVGPAQIAGYEGTGLGLAISKQYIEMQGGRIWAESEPGKGNTFTFTLPRKKVVNT